MKAFELILQGEIFSFSYFASNVDDIGKIEKVLYMFVDLFGTDRFERDILVRNLRLEKEMIKHFFFPSLH